MSHEAVYLQEASLMSPPLYVYDGDCALCSRFVRFLIKREQTGQLQLATAQSAAGRAIYKRHGLCPETMETAILEIGDDVWINLDLFIEGLALCGWPWKAARVLRLLPRPVSDWFYRRIANNRKLFNRGSCPVPSREMRERLID